MFFYTFMPKLFNMSLTASVAIVLVILLRLLLKKAPKVISYALWGVVLFRLLCPVSIGSNFSVYNLFDAPAQESGTITSVIEYVPSNIVHTEYPSVALPVPGISDVINDVLPQGQEQLVADPLEAPMSFATYAWMIGVLVMVIYSIVSYIRLRRKLSVVVPLRDNIFIADDIKSPFVVGLFRPKIYLPCNLGDKEQEYIILHEQHHIKRLDHVMKALAFLALAIHWFNPLVWVAFILASKDMEMSCDEAVIRKIGGDVRADYSASLLTLATGRRIIAGMPLAFGEGNTKGRIRNLANWKKPAFWVVLVAVIACIVLAVCLLTNPETKQDLSFLNYENLVSVAAQSDTHPASKSDDQSRYIIDGPQLAKLLDTSKWIAQTGITRRIQRDTDQNSKSSIQITLDGTYLKVFDTDTANIYDPTTGKDRYYRMADGDYEKLLAMLSLDSEGTADDAVAGKTYLYENEGIGGSFTITLYDDGTFTYYEGMASSYIGVGSWEQDGNSITMTDDGHGGYGLVNHFRRDDEDLVFVEQDSDNFIYVKVKDGEKFSCTGEAFKLNDTSVVVSKWFDYLEAPDEMPWDRSLEINLPEFPDVTFRWSYGEMVAVKGSETTSLYTGMPIWNTYFCDLSGDGLPELCSTISWGSGMIDNRVMIYDYANGVSYSLEDRGVSDYTLRQNESDGQLYVDKTAHVGGGLLSTGRLVFEDDCLQVLWPEKPNDNIREITDPTDDPNFAYDTAVEKIYEDERNEYFISGLYSQHIIVEYTDGTQEDIVTALNAGRATFVDLDKFGIRYWAEPKGDELYSAILNAIRGRNKSDKPDGLLHCASFVMLKQESLAFDSDPPRPMEMIVYGIALHEAYGFSGHTFHGVEGSHIPTVITFEVINGEYVLKDYWTPRDGSYYASDVMDKFPDDIEDEALDTQKYVLAQKQECYDQAVRYGSVDTDYAVEYLFEVIESSPATSSRPSDYIDAHPSEYRELTYYGSYTLRYIFSRFLEGNQTGLRGHLMRAVLDDIAPEAQLRLYAETGQEYFDEWKAGAIRVSEQHDMDWIKANQPAIWLLLQMINE